MTKQYFAYSRISDPKQGLGTSLDVQPADIAQYAQKNGMLISQWFEERKSASKKGRTVFAEMIKQLLKGEADGLIMHKVDRSSRNWADWAKIHELQDAGIEVHFAVENVDFSSLGGRLTADIQAAIAAHYSRNLKYEALKGLNGRLKQGLYPFKAPLGYVDTGKGKAKTICPKKGPKIIQLFENYATGEHSLLSLVDVAARIKLTNFRGRKVTKTCIENMLRNPFYIGLMYVKSRNETYQGVHEPLINEALFKRVQKVRENKSVKKVTKHDYVYRRLFSCGRCNRTYTGERQKGHVYYRCHTKGCTQGALRQSAIDQIVYQKLRDQEISDVQAVRLHENTEQWVDNILKVEQGTPVNVLRDRLKHKQEKLLDALLDGNIDKQTFEVRKAQFLVSEQELSNQAQNVLNPEQIQTNTQHLFELLKSLYLTYSLAKSAEKRQMLQILFSNHLIDGKNVELSPQKWMRKATNLVTVLSGAHSGASFRTGQDVPFLEIEELYGLFMSQEWEQISELHKQIQDRERAEELPKVEQAVPYDQAA